MSKRFFICLAAAVMLSSAGCSDDSDKSGNGSSLCGNGILDDKETCDDGNASGGDGCSAKCRIEMGWECPEVGSECIELDPEKATCGNNRVESGEECDDGNVFGSDGCTSECTVEKGWNCPKTGGKCQELPQCGNGKLEAGEECDDRNGENGDGCSSDCTVEEGWICPIEGLSCTSTMCGNGELDEASGEECDDGEDNVEYGVFACGKNCHPAHYCGDGLFDVVDRKNGEECDTAELEDEPEGYDSCSASCKRVNYCGDGKITHEEQCDDGNDVGGDGCSSLCRQEEGFICKTVDGISKCQPVLCGNGALDQNEMCDDGNRISGDGCSASCMIEKSFQCTQNNKGVSECKSTIGNGVIDKDSGEECDDGNAVSNDGCSDHGIIEPGYVCEVDASGKSNCYAKTCSDGILAGSEECDDGNDISGDGCSKQCRREEGYHCDKPGQLCEKDLCGDGHVTGDETCDEGQNKTAGCVDCKIQKGWQCLTEGQACTNNAVCGNGTLEGAETCEESNECCVDCSIQPFCLCDSAGKNCKKGACGNHILEHGEECDDGNLISGDGCSQICEIEPIFNCDSNGCSPVCGDGLVLDGVEECDDGNLISGDGCSSQCKKEQGFTCEVKIAQTPGEITLPIVYRDFIRYGFTGNGDGFVSQQLYDSLPANCKAGTGSEYRYSSGGNYPLVVGRPIPDFLSYCPDSHCLDAVKPVLGTDGKPELNTHDAIASAVVNRAGEGAYDGTDGSKCIWLYTCPEVFKFWYKDVNGLNKHIDSSLTLTEDACDASVKAPGTYCYSNESFWPMGEGGYGSNYSGGGGLNGEFSSEFQTYFKYKGGETLVFNGDDDVWVFFNGRLGVDVGGIHPAWTRSITLDPQTAASKFHMFPGGIYPLNMFHAERCTGGSSFQLTLAGFVAMGKSTCDSICGDGLIRGNEQCDLGDEHVNDAYAQMMGCVNCRNVPKCGNGKTEAGEVCDAGHLCKDSAVEGCTYHPEIEAQGCDTSCNNPNCNNGQIDAGEACDCVGTTCIYADAANEGKSCMNCKISGCGDGVVDAKNGEECDDGNLSDEDMCTTVCKAPYCGDGVVSTFLGEVCDDGKNDGSYGGCGLGCAYLAPYCGDGVVDALNEVCDDGTNDGSYGGCMPGCKEKAPHCGDGVVQMEYESCDDGERNGTTECSIRCRYEIN